MDRRIAQIRNFNRVITRRLGALGTIDSVGNATDVDGDDEEHADESAKVNKEKE